MDKLLHNLCPHDTFQLEPIWIPNSEGTYCDYTTENQCTIPLEDFDVLLHELQDE